jgi:hypothetical protein
MIEKKPFTRYDLEDEDKGERITVRLNPEERAMLDEWKRIFDIQRDSTVLKRLAYCGANVIHGTLGKDFVRFLLKKDRARYDTVSRTQD